MLQLAPQFRVEVDPDPSSPVVRVSGEIDCVVASAFHDALLSAYEPGQPLIVDVAGVTFMGSSALTAFVRCANQADGDGLVVRNASPRLRHIFEITGLAERFGIDDEAPAGPGS